jgi:hypothetical protein
MSLLCQFAIQQRAKHTITQCPPRNRVQYEVALAEYVTRFDGTSVHKNWSLVDLALWFISL